MFAELPQLNFFLVISPLRRIAIPRWNDGIGLELRGLAKVLVEMEIELRGVAKKFGR